MLASKFKYYPCYIWEVPQGYLKICDKYPRNKEECIDYIMDHLTEDSFSLMRYKYFT